MRPISEQEWYVVAAIFIGHVFMAMIFLFLLALIFVAVFLGIAWLVAML